MEQDRRKKTAPGLIGSQPVGAGDGGGNLVQLQSTTNHAEVQAPSPGEMNQVRNESQDHAYFLMIPQVVLSLCRDPYDLALWCRVREIAGETSECYLSTADLATFSMMSVGKAVESREYLFEKGLLQGDLRQDPGYPQPVWHLKVPDLWPRNTKWAQQHPALRSRLEEKAAQRGMLAAERAATRARQKEASPGEGNNEASPGEERPMPGEERPMPGEANKNPSENLNLNPVLGLSGFLSAEEAWKRCLAILEVQRPPGEFAGTRGLARENGTLHVRCRDPRQRSWLSERIPDLVTRGVSEVLGEGITVVFELPD